MAKKGVKYYIPGAIALVFGIAAFCMMFLEGVKYSADLIILSFNFMAFIAFLLPVIGGLIAVLFKNGLITKIVSTACFVVGAVFLFSMVGFATIGMSDFQLAIVEQLNPSLGVGCIVGAVLSIIGGAVCLFKGSIAKALGGD